MPARAPLRRRAAPSPERFYAAALSEIERAEFAAALKVEGLDQEIALLRLKVIDALRKGGLSALALNGLTLLVRAVVAKYRLGPGDAEALQKALAAIAGMSDRLEAEGRDDAAS
jgi:hypothetical protein